MAAARRHTAARWAYDVWPQDSKVFCACARRFIASASVRSSKVATTSLLYGLTVRYAMVFPPFVCQAAPQPLLWTSCLVLEHCSWQAITRSWGADAVLLLSIRVRRRHVVTATAKGTYLPAGKVPEVVRF